jgi:hypothetical protein
MRFSWHRTVLILLTSLVVSSTSFCQIADNEFYVESFPIPELYYSKDAPELPDSVWNHKLKFFPDSLYNQNDVQLPNCGQASGIYYCLSYMFNKAYDREADSTNIFDPNHTYNFLNGGDGYYGVSTFDSWNIVKSQGCASLQTFQTAKPSEIEYGINPPEFFLGSKWMDGYERYYQSMSNRISDYYSLDLKTEEDLILLKHFLNDGFTPGYYGNIGIIYSDNKFFFDEGNYHLYPDTNIVESQYGTKVYHNFCDDAEHSLTIVGYTKNRFVDFNNDGIISDTIDINGDGLVNHQDNETCLWIVVNSIGTSFGRDIFLMKYDMICDVWNSQIFFPVPEVNYQPDITLSLEMEHKSRNSLKFSIGVSSNTESDYPEYIIDFPVFNYQGGSRSLSGVDTLINPDRLEIGIDISEINKYISLSGNKRLFLIIDNAHTETCKVLNAKFIDYTSGSPNEINIIENSIIKGQETRFYSTVINMESKWDNNNIVLLDESKKLAFSPDENITIQQVYANGGTGYYTFSLFNENEYSIEYCNEDYEFIPTANFDSQYLSYIYPEFPVRFAGKDFARLTVEANGTVSFNRSDVVLPFLYPYQLYPLNYYNDLKIELFAGEKHNNKHMYYFENRDESFKLWLNSDLRLSLEFFHDGEILCTFWNDHYFPRTTSGLSTYSRKYYFSEPVRGVSIYNAVRFIPNNNDFYFSVRENGEISCSEHTPPGEYELKLIVKDTEHRKLFQDIKITVIEQELISSLYPNPTTDIINIDINSRDYSSPIIEIINTGGQIACRFETNLLPGYNTIELSTKSLGLSSGRYICRITTDYKAEEVGFVVLK